MNSGIKRCFSEIKFYIIIFLCAFVVSAYTVKPAEEPEFITNEKGEILACSVCDKAQFDALSRKPSVGDTQPATHGKVVKTDNNQIKRAIVEHVELYPKEHVDSDATITRKAMLVRYPNSQATVLVCHGFMCDRFDVGLLRQVFPKNYNIMTFDFRAHGENRDGQECTFGHNESQDVITAGQFLRNHPELKDKPLFVYGFSMGAAASIEAQSQAGIFDAMILDCPFDSTENVIKRGLSNMKMSVLGYEFAIPGRSYLEQYAFHPYVQSLVKAALKTVANFDPQDIQVALHPCSPVESIKKVDVPCFFIHCKNDEKVPLDAVKDVFAGASGPKKLWITNGRRHFDSYFYNPEEYARQVKNFLKTVMREPNAIAISIDDAVIEDTDHTDSVENSSRGES